MFEHLNVREQVLMYQGLPSLNKVNSSFGCVNHDQQHQACTVGRNWTIPDYVD
jgi:hypothetical protein